MTFQFEDLDVYNKSLSFVDAIYSATATYPKHELFCLTSQLRRAAISIPSNVAEGSARTKKEFGRFVDISRGSTFECVTLLKVSLEQGYLKSDVYEKLEEALVELSKMLSGLKRSLK